MPRRNTPAYLKALGFLKTKLGDIEVKEIMTDFEDAVSLAAQAIFPNAELKKCYFHYVQAIGRKFKKLGLKKRSEKLLESEVRTVSFGFKVFYSYIGICKVFTKIVSYQNIVKNCLTSK